MLRIKHILVGTMALTSSFSAIAINSNHAQTRAMRLVLKYDKPATAWTEALPLGNGRLGVMVFGGINDERLQINESTLWGGLPQSYANPQSYAHLHDTQRLIFEGKIPQAEALAEDLLGKPHLLSAYLPFVDIKLHFEQATPSSYERILKLDDAVASTMYTAGGIHYTREAFVSYPDKTLVLHITASEKGALNFVLSLNSLQAGTQVKSRGKDELDFIGQVQPRQNPAGTWIAPWDHPGEKFAAVVKIKVKGGVVRSTNDHLEVSRATEATIIFEGETSFRNYEDINGQPLPLARRYVSLASQRDYQALYQRHADDFRRLFERTQLTLGPDTTERMTDQRIQDFSKNNDPALAALYYAFGRYLLISSSRSGGQPANLQGLWNADAFPAWGSKWTTNINLQMNYWLAETGDLWETENPLWKMLKDLQKSGRETARVQYHARGWVLHHNTDLWRATAPVDGVWGLWPMGGAWLANQMWDHYLFSEDRLFLKDQAYPAMKGAVEFALDTLVEAPAGTRFPGRLVTNPSTSPENQYLLDGKPVRLTYAPTMDIELLGELFQNFERASSLLGVDASLRARVTAVAKRLPPLQVGRRGQLQEWIDDYPEAEPSHRHVSHLYALYPGHTIDLDRTPALAAAAKKTLELRGDGGTGWARAWRVALWARLRNAEQAYTNLKALLTLSTLPNMFDVCPPFQIDGNFGGAAGIIEMLVQSNDSDIRILPALPKEWPQGSLTGLRVRGGGKVDIAWDAGHLTSLTLHVEEPRSYRIIYGNAEVNVHVGLRSSVSLNGELQVKR